MLAFTGMSYCSKGKAHCALVKIICLSLHSSIDLSKINARKFNRRSTCRGRWKDTAFPPDNRQTKSFPSICNSSCCFMSSPRTYLIINADDFGYCPRRDRAILDLFEQRSISSTSLLVNGDYAAHACTQAKRTHLPMGLHLNLTEGRPVTDDLSRIRSLVDSQGLMHGKFGLRARLDQGSIQTEHLLHEIEMQLIRYQGLTDSRSPFHLDGHQHIHVHPKVVDSVARLAQQYHVQYIRVPADPMLFSLEPKNSFYDEIDQQAQSAKKVFNQYGLKSPEHFFGMTTMGSAMTLETVEQCLKTIPKAGSVTVEWMCHPGYPSDPHVGGCGTGCPDHFSQSHERQEEFDLLSNMKLKKLFDKYNVQVCTYEDLVNGD